MDCCFNLQPAFGLSLPLDSVCVDRRLGEFVSFGLGTVGIESVDCVVFFARR